MGTDSELVFITGYPESILARRVLQRVLAASDAVRVACVVDDDQRARAEAEVAALGVGLERVTLYAGKLTSMDFGLSGQEFRELAQGVSVIHHCAATTFLAASREEAKLGNVVATREVLELAEAAGGLQRLVHWSTALVSGARRGIVREDELDASSGFRNRIERTRFRAERIVQQASQHLPVTVVRPSILVGDSNTGEIDRFEGPYLLVRLMLNAPSDLKIPMPALGDVKLNLVPIDYVVAAGMHIAAHRDSMGKTFHLVDPRPLTARQVFELLSRATGHRLLQDSLAGDMLGALLQFPGMQRIAPAPRAFLQQALTDVVYDSRNTASILKDSGIECPAFDTYVPVLVNYVKREMAARRSLRPAAKRDSGQRWSFR